MPGIRYADVTPAINLFNANVARGDAERRAEEQDFTRRFQAERAIGLDKGLRETFGRTAEAAPVAAAPVATAPQAAAPAISAYTAQQPDFEQVAAAPIATGGPAAPAATAAPMAPARPAAAQATGGTSYRDVMSGLSKVPGAGSAMLNLYSSERKDRASQRLEERKIHMEGIRLFTDASKNGDVATMRAVSQRYDLGIPPEALNRREIMAELAAGTNTAKGFGITDDERALAFGMGYVDALASGADPRSALQAGFSASKKVQVAPKLKNPHYYTAADNSVQAVGPDLVARPVQGPKARPPQPPFALTQGGADAREQGLANMAWDNAVKVGGRMFPYMSEQEQNALYSRELARLRGRPAATPAPAQPGAPAPAAKPPANRPSLESFYR